MIVGGAGGGGLDLAGGNGGVGRPCGLPGGGRSAAKNGTKGGSDLGRARTCPLCLVSRIGAAMIMQKCPSQL
ncbi:hypothetical protein GCM10027570_05850 [Streptomonospora sediminis]